jgi:hypothetical protein
VVIVATVASRCEEAGKVLLEADARFFGDAGGVGIEGLKKIVDFLLDLDVMDLDLHIGRWDDLPWLDLVVHFRLHS